MSPCDALKYLFFLFLYNDVVHGQYNQSMYQPPAMYQPPMMYLPRPPLYQDLARPSYYYPTQNYPPGIQPRGFPGMYPYPPPFFMPLATAEPAPKKTVVISKRQKPNKFQRRTLNNGKTIYPFHNGDVIDYEIMYDSMPPEDELANKRVVTFVRKYKKGQPRVSKYKPTSNDDREVYKTETETTTEPETETEQEPEITTEYESRELTQEDIDRNKEGERIDDTNEIPTDTPEEEHTESTQENATDDYVQEDLEENTEKTIEEDDKQDEEEENTENTIGEDDKQEEEENTEKTDEDDQQDEEKTENPEVTTASGLLNWFGKII